MPPLPFYYVVVVWGEKYVDLFLNVALPCLLAPGNLPGLPNLRESRFLVVTTRRDWERIVGSPVFQTLRKLVEPAFIALPSTEDKTSHYFKAAKGHQAAARLALENNAFCVYLGPDFLLSDGALRSLVQLASSGKQAVLVPGMRVSSETILAELSKIYSAQTNNDVLSFAPRTLVDLCLPRIHPENQRYNWDHPYFSQSPVLCTWSVPGEQGLLVRAFHLHPLLVKINKSESLALLDTNTIDDEFLGFNFSNWQVIHVETDSDNIVLFSLTEDGERHEALIRNSAGIQKLRDMAYSPRCNPLHRYFFTKAIKLHTGALNKTWSRIEDETGFLAYQVLKYDPTTAAYLRHVGGRLLLREVINRVRKRAVRLLSGIGKTTTRFVSYISRLRGSVTVVRKPGH